MDPDPWFMYSVFGQRIGVPGPSDPAGRVERGGPQAWFRPLVYDLPRGSEPRAVLKLTGQVPIGDGGCDGIVADSSE